MKPIKEKIRKTSTQNIFHDTKGDVKMLANYCNMLADKINELNDEVEELRKKLQSKTKR